MLKDKAHNHALKLVGLDKEADIRSCVACTQGIIDNSYYICPEVGCDYFLHKFCGELPLEMKHGMHPKHPLTLNKDLRRCNACEEEPNGYFYSCAECVFDLDLICATSAERQLEHPGHPHPLTLLRKQIQANCNCCDQKQEGIFYQCQKCVIFWMHELCASFGTQADSPKHPHPLHFVYSDQSFHDLPICDICFKEIDKWRVWYLQCVPCNFSSHVHCALFARTSSLYQIQVYQKLSPC